MLKTFVIIAGICAAVANGCEGGATASTLADYDCMLTLLGGAYTLYYTKGNDSVSMAAEASTPGWVGLAWAATKDMMIGADSVIGFFDGAASIDVYALDGKAVSLIVPTTNIEISDASVEEAGGVTTIMFTVPFSAFSGEGPYNMLAAYGEMDMLSYHGNRGGFELTL